MEATIQVGKRLPARDLVVVFLCREPFDLVCNETADRRGPLRGQDSRLPDDLIVQLYR
jgi:hypothetical protein